jgi:N-acylneuraminate cytidylyltransferase/CMP-N,N'-diacetyllegionaminic acid synthase
MKSGKFLGFIPARGGSKGIPRKNLYPLGGKPLLQYSFEAAQKSRHLSHVLLSTDDDEILSFGKQFSGIDCSYKRPAELAQDASTTADTMIHGIQWLEERGLKFDNVVLLQPTCPLRSVEDIDGCIESFIKGDGDSLISVDEVMQHPFDCLTPHPAKQSDGKIWRYVIDPPPGVTRRQDYPGKYYFINGAVYIRKIESFKKDKKYTVPGKSELYEMPADRGVDIDTYLQMALAEALISMMAKR